MTQPQCCLRAAALSQGPLGRSEGLLGSGLRSLRVFSQHLRPPNAPASRCPPASPAPPQPLSCSEWNQFSWEVVKVRPQLKPRESAGNTRGPSGADRRVCVCVRVCVHMFTAVGRHLNKAWPPAVVKAAKLDRGRRKGGTLSESPMDTPGGSALTGPQQAPPAAAGGVPKQTVRQIATDP